MKQAIRTIIVGLAAFAATPSYAALIHSYDFNGNLSDSVAGGVALNTSFTAGGSGAASGGTWSYSAGGGLELASQLPGVVYTIEMKLGLADIGGYRKLISFNTLNVDTGLYNLNGALDLFNTATSPTQTDFAIGQQVVVKLTRDATGFMTGSVDGVQKFTYADTTGLYTAVSGLWFVRDDLVQNSEQGAGRLDYIRIYDDAVGGATGGVPEPASWAMMVLGFSALGYTLRRRPGTRTRIRFS